MQVHHVQSTFTERYVLDPARGPVKRREEVLAASGVTTISHDGITYERGEDGTFQVPDDLGTFLVSHRSARGAWHEGPSPFDPRIGAAYQDAEGRWHEGTPEPPRRGRPRKVEA